jgi:hypothetical protein
MRDTVLVLLAAALCAASAWAFWHFLGNDAFSAMSIIVIVILGAENGRLRKQIRAHRAEKKNA